MHLDKRVQRNKTILYHINTVCQCYRSHNVRGKDGIRTRGDNCYVALVSLEG